MLCKTHLQKWEGNVPDALFQCSRIPCMGARLFLLVPVAAIVDAEWLVFKTCSICSQCLLKMQETAFQLHSLNCICRRKWVLSDFICRIEEVNQPSFFNAVNLMGAEGASWCLCRATLRYLWKVTRHVSQPLEKRWMSLLCSRRRSKELHSSQPLLVPGKPVEQTSLETICKHLRDKNVTRNTERALWNATKRDVAPGGKWHLCTLGSSCWKTVLQKLWWSSQARSRSCQQRAPVAKRGHEHSGLHVEVLPAGGEIWSSPPLHALWEDVKETGPEFSVWCPVAVQEAVWPVQGPVTSSWALISHNVCSGTDPDLKQSWLCHIPDHCLLGTMWIFSWFFLKAKMKQAGGDFNSHNDVGHFFPWLLASRHATALREHL